MSNSAILWYVNIRLKVLGLIFLMMQLLSHSIIQSSAEVIYRYCMQFYLVLVLFIFKEKSSFIRKWI